MTWGKAQIDRLATLTAAEDYCAFERIGLSELDDACILDVGCFDGCNTVLKFSPYSGVQRVLGIDPESGAIAEARERTADTRFEFAVSTFETFETDERFDVVYFSHVLQHLEDPAAACRKAFELTKPGGWVIVKTVDDSLKVSHPDPDDVMRRLFSLYEEHVLPRMSHTRHTDRYFGGKCYSHLKAAGFVDVSVSTFSSDTAGKGLEERLALFERCAYFRRATPEGADRGAIAEIDFLLRQWESMFTSDEYYFLSQSLVVIGRKPGAIGSACSSSDEAALASPAEGEAVGAPCRIRRMTEDDLGEVMAIEVEAFPSPWTPVAYAMDLRHNPAARYYVAVDEAGVAGYLGWWLLGESATIMHVASCNRVRRGGVGSALVEHACVQARREGARVMQLEVRETNKRARDFYLKLGFENAGCVSGYYSNPDEDAVVMTRILEGLDV